MNEVIERRHWDEVEKNYYGYRPAKERKAFGQYFTPFSVAHFMAKLALEKKPTTILDPAVGQGIFPALLEGLSTTQVEISGYEVDEEMIKFSEEFYPQHFKVICEDFLSSESSIKYDCIIGNPPYTIYKSQPVAENILKKYSAVIGEKISPMTNIYNLFVLHSLEKLNERGRAVFIVPSEFLGTDYGVSLKKYFLANKLLSKVILFKHDENVFSSGVSSACILVFDKSINKKIKIQLVGMGIGGDLKVESEKVFETSDLDPSLKWYNLFGQTHDHKIPTKKISDFAKSKRGLATGDNAYFLFNKEKIEKYSIPMECLRPCVAKAQQVSNLIFNQHDFDKLFDKNERVYSLDVNFDLLDKYDSVRKYVDHGIDIEVPEKYLPKHRTPWFSSEKKSIPHIFVSTFSRERVKFIINTAQVSHLTCFHGITLTAYSEKRLYALAAYLNSEYCHALLNSEKRRLGGGLNKLEPRDVERIPSPDWDILPEDIIEKLAELFIKLDSQKISQSEYDLSVEKSLTPFI